MFTSAPDLQVTQSPISGLGSDLTRMLVVTNTQPVCVCAHTCVLCICEPLLIMCVHVFARECACARVSSLFPDVSRLVVTHSRL